MSPLPAGPVACPVRAVWWLDPDTFRDQIERALEEGSHHAA